MHLSSPDGKHTMCNHTGGAAEERTEDITAVDCTTCLWGFVRILLQQLSLFSGTLRQLHKVEHSKTIPIRGK